MIWSRVPLIPYGFRHATLWELVNLIDFTVFYVSVTIKRNVKAYGYQKRYHNTSNDINYLINFMKQRGNSVTLSAEFWLRQQELFIWS